MSPEQKKRLRSVKVIASEVLMVVIVVIMVVVLAFLVSGYWINSEGRVDRQGLLQLSSMPTLSRVTIDGVEGSWLERTNLSKNLSSGEHTIMVSREGYDTWAKTINISEGLLYRIHYPRLFLLERTKEKVLDTADFNAATISPDHSYMVLMNNTTQWDTVDLNNEELKPAKIDVGELFVATAGRAAAARTGAKDQQNTAVALDGEILKVDWDRNGAHALMKVKFGETVEWVLLDVKDAKKSINITQQYGPNFSEIQILDNSANNLLVVQNGNLHKIDLGAKAISSVLVENVQHFDHYEQKEVIFSAKRTEMKEGEKPYYVGMLTIGDATIKTLEETEGPAWVTLSKFYEDKYITVLEGAELAVYKKDNFETVADFELSFAPESLKVGHEGEFQEMQSGKKMATLDMESMEVLEWEIEGNDCGWLDNDMLYSVKDGVLVVYDYDGLNRRELASNVSSRFPAAITDDKWLYYFSDGHLVREWLVEH